MKFLFHGSSKILLFFFLCCSFARLDYVFYMRVEVTVILKIA